MRTDRIYIARDGKSGMHVLVRILAVGDIGADYRQAGIQERVERQRREDREPSMS